MPWIALHGLMDNLGTFTRLLPGLPGGITVGWWLGAEEEVGVTEVSQVTALDLPGHGRSSPLHPGANYTWLETVETLHRSLLVLVILALVELVVVVLLVLVQLVLVTMAMLG